MGAKQRAQKRGKHGKGSDKGSPWSQKKSSSSLRVPDLNPAARNAALTAGWQDFAASSAEKHGFSMSQEARNTERHTFGWGTTKLRGNAVAFVSAGHLHGNQENSESSDDVVEDDMQHQQEEEKDFEEAQPADEAVKTVQSDNDLASTAVGSGEVSTQNEREPLPQKRGQWDLPQRPAPASRHLSNSSSSEVEEILFAGRRNPSRLPGGNTRSTLSTQIQQAEDTILSETQHGNAVKKVEVASLENAVATEQPTLQTRASAIQPEKQRNLMRLFQADASSSEQPRSSSGSPRIVARSRRQRNHARRQRRPEVSDEEEAIMQDYIANMVVNDDDEEEGEDLAGTTRSKRSKRTEHYRFYDGAGEENVKVQTKPAKPPISTDLQAIDWSSADLEDFDDLSTTDEEVMAVQQVLRHRERSGGAQYLIVAEGKGTSDAKWVPSTRLISPSAREEIQIFEEIRAIEDPVSDEASSDDDDEEEDDDDSDGDEALNDLLDEMESEDDENENIMAMTARMTDEQIARALAKQEQMGLGSDELILFDGEVAERPRPSKLLADAFTDEADFIPFSSASKKTSRRKSSGRENFPSASAFADALDQDPYGAFDVMDFDRPSLRPRRKGRKSDYLANLDIEDEELADQLQKTWMKDRDKKAARKRAKMEEREAAWLEYGDRAEPTAIKAEIRQFLVQERETLKLVPMDSGLRASVHRLAKALKLNSKSEGKEGKGGMGRYPVLTKTRYTVRYTIDDIWQIDNLLNMRKFFPKTQSRFTAPRGERTPTTRIRRGGGGALSGASYMNGEVVGASAPEIGSENKGRAMLEKMGWKSGMGIGAVGNQGSVETIKHVVKTTKAGLG